MVDFWHLQTLWHGVVFIKECSCSVVDGMSWQVRTGPSSAQSCVRETLTSQYYTFYLGVTVRAYTVLCERNCCSAEQQKWISSRKILNLWNSPCSLDISLAVSCCQDAPLLVCFLSPGPHFQRHHPSTADKFHTHAHASVNAGLINFSWQR